MTQFPAVKRENNEAGASWLLYCAFFLLLPVFIEASSCSNHHQQGEREMSLSEGKINAFYGSVFFVRFVVSVSGSGT